MIFSKNKYFVNVHKHVQMSELHVSCEWRGYGIGGKLFGEICRQARIYEAELLYISGHSSNESQAFSNALGGVEAAEYNDVIFAEVSCDCPLEYDFKEIKPNGFLVHGVKNRGAIRSNPALKDAIELGRTLQ